MLWAVSYGAVCLLLSLRHLQSARCEFRSGLAPLVLCAHPCQVVRPCAVDAVLCLTPLSLPFTLPFYLCPCPLSAPPPVLHQPSATISQRGLCVVSTAQPLSLSLTLPICLCLCLCASVSVPPPPPQPNETISQRGQLTPEQKQRRVVLKRVNLDKGGVRWVGGGMSVRCVA